MRALLALIAVLGVTIGISDAGAQPPAVVAAGQTMTTEKWREDLRFMVAEMERRHPNLHHHVSRDAFQAAVADLNARIPGLQRNQIIVGMMRIAAMVGDGHTRIEPRKDPAFQFRSLPLKLYLFDDGLHVRAAAPGQAQLVGARVEAIGGVAIGEAIRRVSELASRENEIGPRLYIPLYLAMPDVLQAVGLSTDTSSAGLTVAKDGRRWTAQVPVGDIAPVWPPDTDASLMTPDGWVDARTAPNPQWLRAPLDYHRLIEMPAERALYAQLNMVTNVDGQTLDAFGERILERANAMNPRALVLDLRLNQGGNGMLRNGLVRSLIKAEDSDTRLFVLTARGTFSASQFILDDLDRLTDAVILGEPASSRPTHYGDSYRSVLPNSGITVRTSIKYWQSGQDMRDWTPVDIAVPYRFADYAAGRDPVLERALGYRAGPTLAERLAAAASGKTEVEVTAAAKAVRGNWENRYADMELAAIRAARLLADRQQRRQAHWLARWSAQQYPNNAVLAAMLGVHAEAAGATDEARAAFQRALAIDPNDRFARSQLERIEQQ